MTDATLIPDEAILALSKVGTFTVHRVGAGGALDPPIPVQRMAIDRVLQWRPDLGRFSAIPADAYVHEVFHPGAVLAVPNP